MFTETQFQVSLTPNGQFESKMKLSLERASKITPTSLTISVKYMC